MSKICCEGFAFAMPVTSWPSFSPRDQLPARFHAEPRVTAASGLKFGRASWEKKMKIWPNVTAAWGWFWAGSLSNILICWPTAWQDSEEDVSLFFFFWFLMLQMSLYSEQLHAEYTNITSPHPICILSDYSIKQFAGETSEIVFRKTAHFHPQPRVILFKRSLIQQSNILKIFHWIFHWEGGNCNDTGDINVGIFGSL